MGFRCLLQQASPPNEGVWYCLHIKGEKKTISAKYVELYQIRGHKYQEPAGIAENSFPCIISR